MSEDTPPPNLAMITAEPPSVDVVQKLEAVLARARKGEFSSVAIATVNREGVTASSWSKVPSYGLLLGAIVRLMYKINLEMDSA